MRLGGVVGVEDEDRVRPCWPEALPRRRTHKITTQMTPSCGNLGHLYNNCVGIWDMSKSYSNIIVSFGPCAY